MTEGASSGRCGQLCQGESGVVVEQRSVWWLSKDVVRTMRGGSQSSICLSDGSQSRHTGGGLQGRVDWDLGAKRDTLWPSVVVVVTTPGVGQGEAEISGPLPGSVSGWTQDSTVLKELASRTSSQW